MESDEAEALGRNDVARASSERGEVVLRHRDRDGALELRVNGVFVMDDVETTTERLLATETLKKVVPSYRGAALTVMIGGLGLGYTLAEVLADLRVEGVTVAEIEPSLVDWHLDGLVPNSPIADPRVQIEVGDVRDVVRSLVVGTFDLMLLDVDNGPDFLVYDANAAVYREPFLEACRAVIRPGGLLAVWSAETSPALVAAIETVFGRCEERRIPVRLGRRQATYHLFLGH